MAEIIRRIDSKPHLAGSQELPVPLSPPRFGAVPSSLPPPLTHSLPYRRTFAKEAFDAHRPPPRFPAPCGPLIRTPPRDMGSGETTERHDIVTEQRPATDRRLCLDHSALIILSGHAPSFPRHRPLVQRSACLDLHTPFLHDVSASADDSPKCHSIGPNRTSEEKRSGSDQKKSAKCRAYTWRVCTGRRGKKITTPGATAEPGRRYRIGGGGC